ncbi:hypothetical protein BS17DRAFT_89308 [Gyrodon lividus]|nr:hypothetical protein BS17DRAFT_89308 [Gyrodon lividus]
MEAPSALSHSDSTGLMPPVTSPTAHHPVDQQHRSLAEEGNFSMLNPSLFGSAPLVASPSSYLESDQQHTPASQISEINQPQPENLAIAGNAFPVQTVSQAGDFGSSRMQNAEEITSSVSGHAEKTTTSITVHAQFAHSSEGAAMQTTFSPPSPSSSSHTERYEGYAHQARTPYRPSSVTIPGEWKDKASQLGSTDSQSEEDEDEEAIQPKFRGRQLKFISPDVARRAVDRVFSEALAHMPRRLICTDPADGRLYTADDFTAAFKASPQYSLLLSLLTTEEAVKEKEFIKAAICSFFDYAMFSHRWGAPDDEPLLSHMNGSVYDMRFPPEITKLKGFCHTAWEHGIRWAWSDTCCIDKRSRTEVEETILAMFSWYQNSSVTIVYLSDVEASSPPEMLKRSEWFTRGWTLQELLAPSRVQFYKANWASVAQKPRKQGTYSDHRRIPQINEVLIEATGIAKQDILEFTPGLENVRERLRWVAHRETTKVEDMAYSIMGLFGISIPILYGEKQWAFARLQRELVRLTNDPVLFDWTGQPSKLNTLLAGGPSGFYDPASVHPEHTRVITQEDCQNGKYVLETLQTLMKGLPQERAVINGKMKLPMLLYLVSQIQCEEVEEGVHRYCMKAPGLGAISVCSPDNLDEVDEEDDQEGHAEQEGDGRRQGNRCVYHLGRIVDEHLLATVRVAIENATEGTFPDTGSVHGSRTAPESRLADFVRALRLPFTAYLLLSHRGALGPFRKIQTVERIIVEVSKDTSLMPQVRMVTVC